MTHSPTPAHKLTAPQSRRAIVWLAAVAMMLCAAAGGGAWWTLRCDLDDHVERVAPSWVNERESFLFACGQVWRSGDSGETWVRVPSQGLPRLVRQGHIAADLTPGRFYLGLLLSGQSRPKCPLCLLTEVRPVIYVSSDGGAHWTLARQFQNAPAGDSGYRALHADPDYSDAAWAVLTIGGETAYYATNTGGRLWRKTCVERGANFCDPPDEFLKFQHLNRSRDEGVVP